ncbi:MAG: cobalt transporter CbiM, partial [Aliifodinibius sp.]|nr:cobalt transporter CbiM [candidate division Zixibacteria bacterium]NIT60359.1 cobalt transporter CbiM [Fodinibius sp.]NIW43121.1 cobalt transporter CbiM [candidate division Zixibacteria bacterium]NIX58585.1 cobalt transporter CbiM [candidate division Zixibacteria bacterium]NIY28941.1 cobalt transporter CbiM [Fodinibius sp.]
MHISEGVLSAPVLLTGGVIAAGGVAIGLKKMDPSKIPEVAVLASAFFVSSLIRIPLGPANVHLTLNGLLGLLLGWMAFPALLVGLTLQALLFQFGGFTTLGVNTVIMGAPSVITYYLLDKLLHKGTKKSAMFAGAAAGVL